MDSNLVRFVCTQKFKIRNTTKMFPEVRILAGKVPIKHKESGLSRRKNWENCGTNSSMKYIICEDVPFVSELIKITIKKHSYELLLLISVSHHSRIPMFLHKHLGSSYLWEDITPSSKLCFLRQIKCNRIVHIRCAGGITPYV